jgi:hypothetical protein
MKSTNSFYTKYGEEDIRRVKCLFDAWKKNWLRNRSRILPPFDTWHVKKYRDYNNKKFVVLVFTQSHCCGSRNEKEKFLFDYEDHAVSEHAFILRKIRHKNIDALITYCQHYTSAQKNGCRADILRALESGPIQIKNLNHINVSKTRKQQILASLTSLTYLKRSTVNGRHIWDLNFPIIEPDEPTRDELTNFEDLVE